MQNFWCKKYRRKFVFNHYQCPNKNVFSTMTADEKKGFLEENAFLVKAGGISTLGLYAYVCNFDIDIMVTNLEKILGLLSSPFVIFVAFCIFVYIMVKENNRAKEEIQMIGDTTNKTTVSTTASDNTVDGGKMNVGTNIG